jgi:hypothetical protein
LSMTAQQMAKTASTPTNNTNCTSYLVSTYYSDEETGFKIQLQENPKDTKIIT